jgi:hypothetical protein
MILPFSTQLNGKPTYFVEKIWEAFLQKGIQFKAVEMNIGIEALPKNYKIKTNLPKLHTIREDKTNRWKAGVIIDFFINARTKKMFRFAPRISVVSTQKIEIVWTEWTPGTLLKLVSIYIDDECYVMNYEKEFNSSKQRHQRIEKLAYNDGFDTIEDFLAYFNTDFSGKIIHWTDKKY